MKTRIFQILLWVVSNLLPKQALIEYTVFSTDSVGWITVQCKKDSVNQSTIAKITYTFTGLTEKGNAFIEKHLDLIFAHNLENWKMAINHYLKTGRTLGSSGE